MQISEKIRIIRKKSGLSQETLAEQLGVSRQAITKWENGTAKPESDKIVLLSECFGVTTDYLLKDYLTEAEPAHSELLPVPPKKKSFILVKIGIFLCAIDLIAWFVVWYLSVRFPVSFLDWNGSAITGFWGFLKIHTFEYEFLAINAVGLVGILCIAVYLLQKTGLNKKKTL